MSNIYVSCTFEGDLYGKFTVLDAGDFDDCEKLSDGDIFTTDKKWSICPGDELPNGLKIEDGDIPNGWRVCEVIRRHTQIADWRGNLSDTDKDCRQFVIVLSPEFDEVETDWNVVYKLDHENECSLVPVDGLLNPYFMDII